MWRVRRREVWQNYEATMALRTDFAKHLHEDSSEHGINGSKMSSALIDGERREPFEDGGPGVGIRIRAG